MAESFYRWARGQVGGGLVITSARRTRQEQERLYRASLAGQNDGLPALPPGHSDHELGLAFDMARPTVPALQDELLPWLAAAWRRKGGLWDKRDPVHFAAPLYMHRLRRAVRRSRRRLRRQPSL